MPQAVFSFLDSIQNSRAFFIYLPKKKKKKSKLCRSYHETFLHCREEGRGDIPYKPGGHAPAGCSVSDNHSNLALLSLLPTVDEVPALYCPSRGAGEKGMKSGQDVILTRNLSPDYCKQNCIDLWLFTRCTENFSKS